MSRQLQAIPFSHTSQLLLWFDFKINIILTHTPHPQNLFPNGSYYIIYYSFLKWFFHCYVSLTATDNIYSMTLSIVFDRTNFFIDTKCSMLCTLQKLFMIIFNCIMLYLIFNKLWGFHMIWQIPMRWHFQLFVYIFQMYTAVPLLWVFFLWRELIYSNIRP